MRLFATALLFGLLTPVLGCQPKTAQNFVSSAEVLALTDEAEDDEDRKQWEALQDQIREILRTKCGTPTKPVMLGDEDMAVVVQEGRAEATEQIGEPRVRQARKRLASLQHGAAVYERRCQQCHGVSGDGNGDVAEYLYPLPRDYRKGIFKFTSTPYGAKPRRSDIVHTLRRGVSGTAMPAFDRLTKDDLEDVTDYVIALARRGELEAQLAYLAADEGELPDDLVEESVENVVEPWRQAESQLVMPVSTMPEFTPETVEAGRQLFIGQACNKCHGMDGRGGFFGNVEVGDDVWGNKGAAADLTSGMFHGGGRPIDLYRRIYSGINGSPMPGFAGTFQDNPEAIWQLVHFIKDTGERRRRGLPPESFSKETDETDQPDTADQPEADTDQPAGDADKLKDDTEQPDADAEQPEGDANAEPEQPDADTEKPEAEEAEKPEADAEQLEEAEQTGKDAA